MKNNIEQATIRPPEAVQAARRHQLMMEGNLARIDPANETTRSCPSAISLRVLVKDALAHGKALEAIREEWQLEKQPNF